MVKKKINCKNIQKVELSHFISMTKKKLIEINGLLEK